MSTFPEPLQFNGDEPDIDASVYESERYAERAKDARALEQYLSRMTVALSDALESIDMRFASGLYSRHKTIRATLVAVWNRSRVLAPHHEALMIEKPEP